jgi:prepilin-type N-terminal cleavage/methylation domain-containing protein
MLVRINREDGFTLIELTMVLFIVSLLLANFLSPLSTRLEQQNREKTTDELEDIKESLLGYAMINGRLPCPDCSDGNVSVACGVLASTLRNDGRQDINTSGSYDICMTNIGNLPWVDLQTAEHDAWKRHFTYRVTQSFADEPDGAPDDIVTYPNPCGTAAIGISFELCSHGDIDIYDSYIIGTTGYPSTASLVADNVPAVVISHGGDGYEATQTSQQVENYDRNPVNPVNNINILGSYAAANFTSNVFIYSDYARDTSLNPPTQYDDLVMWISPSVLMNRMVISGKLP